MPRAAEHLQQARANRAFAKHLLATSAADPTAMQWAVTAAFYCAVHCIEANLARRAIHSAHHADRKMHLTDPRLAIPARVYTAYQKLKTRSEGARYHLWQFSAAQVQNEILGRHLPAVASLVSL